VAGVTSDWARYERIEDSLDCFEAESVTEEILQDRRQLTRILLYRVWINKEGKIRIEGHIPEVQEEMIFTSSLPRYREPKNHVPFTIEVRVPIGHR